MSLTGHTQAQTLLRHYTATVASRQREAVEGLFTGVVAEDA